MSKFNAHSRMAVGNDMNMFLDKKGNFKTFLPRATYFSTYLRTTPISDDNNILVSSLLIDEGAYMV